MIIALDMGTTNTRLRLIHEKTVVDELKLQLGVRDTVFTGDKKVLSVGVKLGLAELLGKNKIEEEQISMIIASGMIGSDLGLFPIAYVETPITAVQLATAAQQFIMEEITTIPFYVIPGVVNACERIDFEHIDQLDIMRGEETEFFGLDCKRGCPSVTILPGSHTKIIHSDGSRILSCHTTIGGEMISAMGIHTVLKQSLPHMFEQQWDKKYLIKGYEYGKKYGITKALFRVRVGDVLCKESIKEEELTGFFIGAVLQEDIKAVAGVAGEEDVVVVGGYDPVKIAFGVLLEHACANKIVLVDHKEAELAGAWGAAYIAALIDGTSHCVGRE